MLVFMVGSSGVLVLLSGDHARFVPVPQRGQKNPARGLSLKKGGTQPLNARKSFVSRNSSPTTRLMRASIACLSASYRLCHTSAEGSWPCKNSSALRGRRSISEELRIMKLNHPAQIRRDTVLENCIFYIS
jgi:hypothetical protein